MKNLIPIGLIAAAFIFGCGEELKEKYEDQRSVPESGAKSDDASAAEADKKSSDAQSVQKASNSGESSNSDDLANSIEITLASSGDPDAKVAIDSEVKISWEVKNATACELTQLKGVDKEKVGKGLAGEKTFVATAADMQFEISCEAEDKSKKFQKLDLLTAGEKQITSRDPFALLKILMDSGIAIANAAESAIQNDDETAKQICMQLGYDEVGDTSSCLQGRRSLFNPSGCRDGWASPRDNYMVRWDSDEAKFVGLDRDDDDFENEWLASLTCTKN